MVHSFRAYPFMEPFKKQKIAQGTAPVNA